MRKVSFFIDGFNLYHSYADRGIPWAKWMNFRALAEFYSSKKETISEVYFFTALPLWSSEKTRNLKLLIRAEEAFGVKVIYGAFRKVSRRCNNYRSLLRKQRKNGITSPHNNLIDSCNGCYGKYWTHEEKRTDVNIALHLLKLGYEDQYDRAYIISGDSDLIPAIEMTRSLFPTKEFVVLIPAFSRAETMKAACNSHIKMKVSHYKKFRFPNIVPTSDKKNIYCPRSWR